MGGPRIAVDKTQFIKTVQELESKNKYVNMLALQQAVADSPYGKQIGIKPMNVYQYLKKWDVPLQTKKGKQGTGLARIHDKTNIIKIGKAERISNDANAQNWIKEVRGEVKSLCGSKANRFNKVLDKLEKGSFKAAIVVQCVTCCGGDTKEIKECECYSCPLWQFRPYKNANDDALAIIEIDDEIAANPLAVDNG